MPAKHTPSARHFPYQHPLFGTKSSRKTGANSVYFWWWAYLKRNKKYIACCESGGKGRLEHLYQDFGDVRGDDFKAWWQEDARGVRLFAEPRAEDTVRVLKGGETVLHESQALTLSLPLNLPKRFLIRRCRELVAEIEGAKRGELYARKSQAKYQIKGQPNIPALRRALKVYDAVEAEKLSEKKKPYWRIAMNLKLVTAEKMVLASDPPAVATDKRNVMTAIVARLFKRSSRLIDCALSDQWVLGSSE